MPTESGQRRPLERPGLFLVIGIFVLLFGFGSTSASGGLVSSPWDKMVHLGVYAALAIGLRIVMPRLSIFLIAALALSVGLADEFHQSFVPTRQPELDDWLADLAGTVGGLLAWHWLVRQPSMADQCRP